MCFFAQVSYGCGDWKWGNMMERCPRQHRIGETCGAKLVHPDHVDNRPAEVCKTCQEIDVKRRRLQKLQENIGRWEPQGSTFAASLDKAKAERAQVIEKIKELNAKRTSVVFRGAGQDNGSQGGSSYTYAANSRGYQNLSNPSSNAGPGGNAGSGAPAPQNRRHGSAYSPYSMNN